MRIVKIQNSKLTSFTVGITGGPFAWGLEIEAGAAGSFCLLFEYAFSLLGGIGPNTEDPYQEISHLSPLSVNLLTLGWIGAGVDDDRSES